MSYYINTCTSPDNSNISDVFFKPELKIIPILSHNLLNIKLEFSLYGDFSIPVNSIIFSLDTNFGKFEDINMNLNPIKSNDKNKVFDGNIAFNINESRFLSQEMQRNTELIFFPNFKLNTAAFNEANLTLNNINVQKFFNKITTLDETIIQNKSFFSNTFNLIDIANNNINELEINKPLINIDLINVNNINQNWNTFNNFLKISYSNIYFPIVEQFKINLDYVIKNNRKNIQFDSEKDKYYQMKEQIYTNYNYDNNEVILSNKFEGYSGLFIPFTTIGTLTISFKINNIWYTQNFKFQNNQNLFGINGKHKIKIENYEEN